MSLMQTIAATVAVYRDDVIAGLWLLMAAGVAHWGGKALTRLLLGARG